MQRPEGQDELAIISKGQEAETDEFLSIAGCTANVSLIVDGKLICANVGDARTVLCRDWEPIALSIDHKPDDPSELKRIVDIAGGEVQNGRILVKQGDPDAGGLNVSRTLGDFTYKQDKSKPWN